MLLMNVLGNERTELDSVCDEEEEPVEEHYTVRIARPPMFNVLDEEDESERDERKYRSPEAEVASPNIFVVLDL
jgi:hypothetical protein